ncbi:MAG: 16S rRNA (guanine(966)-N(2))-methyltransferase RsmD [Firmicutes bacterium]|nr:16S rRNA (guanine(966)-N(2))-methyltransferase RsmD [Bacillota bacterium]
MRIITGTARGRKLKTLENLDVRPTAERVKEGLFSALQFSIEGRRVLDMFAGSGQLGLEALSRGARSALFLEQSQKAAAVVRENIESCGFGDRSRLVQTDSLSYLRTSEDVFDIAFIDPPYADEKLNSFIKAAVEHMSITGTVCVETPKERELPESFSGVVEFVIDKVYVYGKTKVTMYRRKPVKE